MGHQDSGNDSQFSTCWYITTGRELCRRRRRPHVRLFLTQDKGRGCSGGAAVGWWCCLFFLGRLSGGIIFDIVRQGTVRGETKDRDVHRGGGGGGTWIIDPGSFLRGVRIRDDPCPRTTTSIRHVRHRWFHRGVRGVVVSGRELVVGEKREWSQME